MNLPFVERKIIDWNQIDQAQQHRCLERPISAFSSDLIRQVEGIINSVKEKGDSALYRFTEDFDGVCLDELLVSEKEILSAEKSVDQASLNAIEFAIKNVSTYQQAQLPTPFSFSTVKGVELERIPRPISCVGLYVPGGNTPLVSSLIMQAIPAKIAGCEQRILCTPPRKDGTIDPVILKTASLCGVSKIYKVGGAQAIAAMAYGTESIPKVDKIYGPGNAWVTVAKQHVAHDFKGADCDLPAGPSELMIIADESANPNFLAADLLSQAEHGIDSQVLLISTSRKVITNVFACLDKQLMNLSRRDIAFQSLQHARFILLESVMQLCEVANQYAPEHLSLQVDHPEKYLKCINNAGAIFIGEWTPEAAGDYVTGANHVLPTGGKAVSCSGLSVTDFMKFISIQKVTDKGIKNIARAGMTLAALEGLTAHEYSLAIRLDRQEEANE